MDSELISATVGIVGFTYGLYIRYIDKNNRKKATLYYPLFLACEDIIDIFDQIKNDKFKDSSSEEIDLLLKHAIKTLDDIVYNYGSFIYLKEDKLQEFTLMRKFIYKIGNCFGKLDWATLNRIYKEGKFDVLENYANSLKKECMEKEADLMINL